jgi:NADP-dependent 3-hydroxy acid dehydrogenase YdfG
MNVATTREFAHQVAVVTGASSGVGSCIAQALAAKGAEMALVGRRVDALRSVAERCGQFGVKARCYQVDLLAEPEIPALKERLLKDFDGVDILIHSAGVITLSSITGASLHDFDRQYRCNLRAPFALTQALLTSLISRQGQVVFLNSTAGLQAVNGVSQYAATKHALKAVADSLRDEVNGLGVRVLSVFLGRTATPMQARVHETEGRDYHPEELIQPEQVATIVANALALGREAEITEIRVRPMRKPKPSGKSQA